MLGRNCWVPHCTASKDLEPNRIFFPLPRDPKFKETWLALTGKKVILEEQVYFCDSHFRQSAFEKVLGKVIGLSARALPYHRMPQMICRTCMTTISHSALFCVISGTIPSPVPPEYETDLLVQCRPEPLYQILTFCIPNLNLEQNPPSLICIKCYHIIWQYFIFKLTCNSLENRIRGDLSLEQYGKLVLCRGCPTTSGTRFFILNETDPMGRVLKKVFLNNYPTNIVPLKLCLKCWNLLFKLTQFNQQCLALDQIMQRCAEVNQTLICNNIPSSKDRVRQSFQNLMESSPSTSKSSSDFNSGSFNKLQDIEKTGKIESVEERSRKCVEKQLNSQVDPEMPKLLPQVETEFEPKPETSICTKENFTVEFKLLLINLVQKHSNLIKPDLNPIEKAKADLEMWVKIMNEIHNFGYTYTLGSIQPLYNEMKLSAWLARKTTGPMTYLNYLVNNCKAQTSIKNYITDNSSTIGSENTESCDSNLTEQINVIRPEIIKNYVPQNIIVDDKNTVTLENPLKRPVEPITIMDDCDVICIDDSETENDSGKDVNNTTNDATGSNNCDINRKEVHDISKTTTSDSLRKIRIKRLSKRQGQKLVKPTGTDSFKDNKIKGKLKQWRFRDVWKIDQKLELVREMRNECNILIEKGELDSFKYTPWKNILVQLASKGFKGYNFAKLYSVWGKMKISATIYEKNGQDIVDDEVWELLQLHKDVQKNLLKKRRNDEEEDVLQNGECTESEISSATKKSKLLNSDCKNTNSENPVNSIEIAEKDTTVSTNQSPAKSEQNNTEKPITSLSDGEKLKILDLIELQLAARMLENKGVINESFSTILEDVKYKNYSVGAVTRLWRKLAMAAAECKTTPTPVHRKVLKLLNIYRQNKVSRKINVFNKTENAKQGATVNENVSSSSIKRRGRPRKYRDKDKLDLISIIKSFNNEVFKKSPRLKRLEFWNQVTAKYHAMGYTKKANEIHTMWNSMLRSAKLTWAQDGRVPLTGDKEIIDFMMEVIKGKEKSKQDAQLDFNEEVMVQDNSNNCEEDLDVSKEDSYNCNDERLGKQDSNNSEELDDLKEDSNNPNERVSKEDLERYEEHSEENEEPLHKSDSSCIADVDEVKSSDELDSKSTIFNDYDYVSLEDIQKEYGQNIFKNPKPTIINEVVEILDSEDE